MPRFVAACVVAGLVLAVGVSPPAFSAPSAVPRAKTVTLVTGDLVEVDASGKPVRTKAGPGRSHVSFQKSYVRGSWHVVPSDALTPVASGRVDRRLFDVTALLSFGYDKRGDLPLIVTYAKKSLAHKAIEAAGGRVQRELDSISGVAIQAKKDVTFWKSVARQPAIEKVWLDGLRQPVLDKSVPQIGAPQAWKLGSTGKGVKVAVLDTGIDDTHPDLKGKVKARANFTASPTPADEVGHGTHVASTIAGNGKKYRGVAPDAMLLDGKICESYGCRDSSILAGMQWAAAEQRARVANLSLGGPDYPYLDPIEQAVNTLTAKYGTLFVIAAGNEGTPRTVGSPGSADAALTVGAVDKANELADFSSRGPRVGDGAIKPDVTAPGVDITAARAKALGPGSYIAFNGTSMATPHVAGSAAILAQQRPDWKPERLKAALMSSARPHPNQSVFEQGAGRVDVERAVKQSLLAEPGSLNLGVARWPHADDKPVVRKVTYRNLGSSPVTLKLAVSGWDPRGKASGAFTLDRSQLVVPAGGTATATLAGGTVHDGPDGQYTGQVVATVGQTVVRTPVTIVKERESYDVAVKVLDHDGKAARDYELQADNVDTGDIDYFYEPDGTITMRLPKGRYLLNAVVNTGVYPEDGRFGWLVRPLLDVRRDGALTFDARAGKPLRIGVPHRGARPFATTIAYQREFPGTGGFVYREWFFDGVMHSLISTAQLGPGVPADQLVSRVYDYWNERDGEAFKSYAYNLVWFRRGGFPSGVARNLRRSDLATVVASSGATRSGTSGGLSYFPVATNGRDLLGVSAVGAWHPLPVTHTDYLTTDGVAWSPWFSAGAAYPPTLRQVGEEATYQRGRTYRTRWNTTVAGPAFPLPHGLSAPCPAQDCADARAEDRWATRLDNRITVQVPLFTDGVAGRSGFSAVDEGRTTLYRDGVLVGSVPHVGAAGFTVPRTQSTYRLEVSARRDSVSDYSTQVEAAWTFRSKQWIDPDEVRRLPLLAVRFGVSERVGSALRLPVWVERQPGAPGAPTIGTPRVEVSFDDGRHWQVVAVTSNGKGWLATVKPPAGATFLSVRAEVSEDAGNAVEQTITRAYGLQPAGAVLR